DELDHVQKLTRELTRLNARLGRLPESAEATPAVGTGGGAGSPRRERRPAPQAGPSKPPANPRPRTAEPPTSKRPQGRPPDAAGKVKSTGRPAPPDQDTGGAGAGRPPVTGSEDLYADLTRRITELQRERQGYWQKILKAING